jgi:septal ring factor EnvC (AmiA/AmiB activator)
VISSQRIFIAWLFCLSLFGTAQADQKDKLDSLRKRISAVKVEIDKTSESKADAADALKESEVAISDINRKLAKLKKKKRKVDLRLDELTVQESELNRKVALQRTQLGKLLNHQYLNGKQEYLKLLLSNQNPSQVARELQYFTYIARDRASFLATLRNNLVSLSRISNSVREKRSEIEVLQSKQADHKNSLDKKRLARKQVLTKISRQLSRQRREIKKLKRDENRLSQLVRKIANVISPTKDNALFRNDRLPDNRWDGKPFKLLKGKLTLPVKGEVTNKFNSARPDSTVSWKGLFLRTPNGNAVKAIAAGQVVFADWLRGFGNLLIIDHGSDYMSLYGYNETLYKEVGDLLRGGDTIATVGNSGGNKEFGLYFELRHKSKPFDPMRWMTKK